ncbi:MAG: hypothetical protein ACO29O_01520, partial [Chitinophagaceae bacterium]
MLSRRLIIFTLLIIMILAISCGHKEKPKPIVIVPVPEELQPVIIRQIDAILDYALDNDGLIEDSLRLDYISNVSSFFEWSGKNRIWGEDRHWQPIADSMMGMLDSAKYYGLYAEDYYINNLKEIVLALKDTAKQKDAALWARGELLFSNAFIHMAHDLHVGRLEADSTTLKKNWELNDSFYHAIFNQLMVQASPKKILESLEPRIPEYDSL